MCRWSVFIRIYVGVYMNKVLIVLFGDLTIYHVYVMTRLIKDRLCIKMTFMHNDCRVNYYEKCCIGIYA